MAPLPTSPKYKPIWGRSKNKNQKELFTNSPLPTSPKYKPIWGRSKNTNQKELFTD